MGEAAALVSALSWATAGVAVTSLSARLPAAALSALQMVVASVALLAVLMISDSASEFGEAGTLTLLGVAGSAVVGLTLADPIYVRALSIMGMQRTYPVTVGLFIVLTAAAGVLILDEEFTVGLLTGGVLIGLGCYLIVVPGGKQHPAEKIGSPLAAPTIGPSPAAVPSQRHKHRFEGYVMLGLAPLLWAIATVWLASARGELSPIAASALRMPVGAGLLVLFLLSTRPRDLQRAAANRRDLVMIAGAGLGGMAVGSLLYVYALMEAGVARAAVLSASSPLFVIPLAMLFLDEILTRRILMGTAISVTGIVLVITL
jgi:drug/metabolite transporter (DMT)-like permease